MISICLRVECPYFKPYKQCMAEKCPYEKPKEGE